MANGIFQVLDATGMQCCDCGVQVECGCPAPICSMKGRSIGGTATFIGFPEYVASVPPNFYRHKDLNGNASASTSTDGRGCFDPGECSQSWQYSGSIQYDKITGAITTTAQLVQSGNCAAGGTIYPNECNAGDFNNVNGVGFNYPDIYTRLTHSFGQDDFGCRTNMSGFVGGVPGNQSCIAVLSDQDLPADAIFRLLGPNPVWVGQNGGAVYSNTSFTGTWTNTSLTFREGQVQVTIPFPKVKHTYQVVIQLGQRAYPVVAPGIFNPVGAIQSIVACYVAGAIATPWITIPVTPQFENVALSCAVTDLGT